MLRFKIVSQRGHKWYQSYMIFIIFASIFLFALFSVEKLIFSISAHCSCEYSLFLNSNKCNSLSVKFAFSIIKSISFFVKSGILSIKHPLNIYFTKFSLKNPSFLTSSSVSYELLLSPYCPSSSPSGISVPL